MDSNTNSFPCILYDPFMIDNLVHLPEMCVFGLINEESKIVLIYRTTNIVTSLARVIRDYKYSNKNILKNFKLIIIEKIEDSNNLWIKYNFWVNEYSNKGYTVYNRSKYKMRYKLRKQILGDFRTRNELGVLFYVKVVSSRYKEVIVGIFDKVSDMDAFTDTYYPGGLILHLEYAKNSITKEYYAK